MGTEEEEEEQENGESQEEQSENEESENADAQAEQEEEQEPEQEPETVQAPGDGGAPAAKQCPSHGFGPRGKHKGFGESSCDYQCELPEGHMERKGGPFHHECAQGHTWDDGTYL
jgi:hypothetical protein